MFTFVMMLVAAYVAVALDTFLIDAKYDSTDTVAYYAKAPWQTVKNAATVAGVYLKRAWAKLAD